MLSENESKPAAMNRTVVERKGDLELEVKRTFDAPARIVFEAWTNPELFQSWWIPKSMPMSIVSARFDIRKGGSYRLELKHPDFDQPMAFFGTYKEVTPHTRLVWTNEESEQGALTTVTFEEKNGKTLLTFNELYPTREAREEGIAGSAEGLPEQFAQLDEYLATRQ
jgi:uncharacterized protein YndB with AHSA1/START domain